MTTQAQNPVIAHTLPRESSDTTKVNGKAATVTFLVIGIDSTGFTAEMKNLEDAYILCHCHGKSCGSKTEIFLGAQGQQLVRVHKSDPV